MTQKKRTYIYLITRHKSPFYFKYSYFYPYQIDISRLNKLCESFKGKKDFTSFSKKRSETKNKICEIYDARWEEMRDFVLFYISADRFLQGMVRTIVGTILYSLKNKLDNEYLENIIAKKNRESADEAVPAKGLYLFKVKY